MLFFSDPRRLGRKQIYQALDLILSTYGEPTENASGILGLSPAHFVVKGA